jgi:hemolysin III
MVHALSHGVGLIASVAGLAVLVVAAATRGDAWHVVGSCIFGSSLVLLYAASTLYHSFPESRAKQVFQVLDRSAIYLLIAGTYTPFMLVCLRGAWGWTLLVLVWSLACLGIVMEVTRRSRARRLSLVLYLLMGWLVVIAAGPLVRSVAPGGVLLLVLGGVTYSLGVIFYAWRRPYHHAVWHGFVLGGSALHFTSVLVYVIP